MGTDMLVLFFWSDHYLHGPDSFLSLFPLPLLDIRLSEAPGHSTFLSFKLQKSAYRGR